MGQMPFLSPINNVKALKENSLHQLQPGNISSMADPFFITTLLRERALLLLWQLSNDNTK